MEAEKLVELNEYTWTYKGANEASLRNICFKIKRGQFVVIIGDSGSGKSTLAYTVSGAIPDLLPGTGSGSIARKGAVISETQGQPLLSAIALQDPSNSFVALTVQDELAFGLENEGREPDDIRNSIYSVAQRLNIFNLLDRSPLKLSGGERQLVAIASILILDRELYVIDDCLSQIDCDRRAVVLLMLSELQSKGASIFLTASERLYHDLIPDEIFFLDGGRISEASDTNFSRKLYSVDSLFAPPFGNICKDVGQEKNGKACTVHVENLSYSQAARRDVKILRSIDIKIKDGESIGLVGKNGSGKTTLAKCIAGLLKPSAGRIEISGSGMSLDPRNVGIVLQNPEHQLFCRTASEEIILGLREVGITGKKALELTNELLLCFQLQDISSVDPFFLSKGQRQALAIASVIATRPAVLILDEPSSALKYPALLDMLQRVGSFLSYRPRILVLISHNAELVKHLCQRVIVMSDGMIEFDESTDVLESLLDDNYGCAVAAKA